MLALLMLAINTHWPVLADGNKQLVVEALWVEPSTDGHLLNMSRYDGKNWAEPSTILSRKHPITSPAIATDLNGTKLVIWSELVDDKSILMQSEKLDITSAWSEPVIFSDFGVENLGVSIIVDPNGTKWVFWAANQGDLDDIYYVNNQNGGWSKPQRVNSENEVPDFRPKTKILSDGDLLVEWKTYDFSVGQYIDAERLFKLDKSEKSRYKPSLNEDGDLEEDGDVFVEDIPLPNFLPSNRASIFHFPDNKLSQSVIVE